MMIYAEARHYAVGLFIHFLTGAFGMSMTYHRLMSHESWKSPRWFKIFGLFCGTIGLTGPCIAWAATHKRHHQFADTKRDPHSPLFLGALRVQFLSMFYSLGPSAIKPFVKDSIAVFFHRNYLHINFLYVGLLIFIDPFAVIYAYFFPAFLLWNTGSLINSLGHIWGYRNYQTLDQSRNNPILAILSYGEGWHNNHHRFPKSAYFGSKWYEFDISGVLIKILRK